MEDRGARAASSPDGREVEVRGSSRTAALVLAIGCTGLALAAALEPFRSPQALVAFTGAALVGAGGLLDRRPKLTLSAEGIRYRRWGRRTIPWREFVGYRWTSWRGQPYLQLLPLRAAELGEQLGAMGRFEHLCSRLVGAPLFGIAVAPLATSEEALETQIARFTTTGEG